MSVAVRILLSRPRKSWRNSPETGTDRYCFPGSIKLVNLHETVGHKEAESARLGSCAFQVMVDKNDQHTIYYRNSRHNKAKRRRLPAVG
ncbi:hypothetical protein scyTo_0021574 [Scyliorhinus torazame]|uniref:Uncharacterized protein n=1 Tax=Scyliorhinus torazame TaxID=75743 RepID=A0A401QA69_SCYTO|nr:hypothetical protein [Scyliorhinus torazame]